MAMQVRSDEGERAEHERAFEKNGEQNNACPPFPPHVANAGQKRGHRCALDMDGFRKADPAQHAEHHRRRYCKPQREKDERRANAEVLCTEPAKQRSAGESHHLADQESCEHRLTAIVGKRIADPRHR